MNSTQNTPIQSQNHIQDRTRSIHSRLALRTHHKESKDVELPGMSLNIDAIQTTINIPDWHDNM